MENVSAVPKPSGKGFVASYYSHIVLNVPDIPKEISFYRDMFGMKVLAYKPEESSQCFLRFGQNTLLLRDTPEPNGKPFCNHFAFVVDNYDSVKVKAELDRRGLNPQPASNLAWGVADPDGFRVEACGPGWSEHIAFDCHGESRPNVKTHIGGCPEGHGG